MNRFARDWPVFVLLIGVIWFVIYVVIQSRKNDSDKDKK
jgi:sensor domain CHASE-containing protein